METLDSIKIRDLEVQVYHRTLAEKKLLPGCSLDVDVDPQGMV